MVLEAMFAGMKSGELRKWIGMKNFRDDGEGDERSRVGYKSPPPKKRVKTTRTLERRTRTV